MFNTIEYVNFNDHYWLKRDSKSVYSSREDKYIPMDDDEYNKWLADNNLPTSHPRDTKGNETYNEMLVVLTALGVGRRYELLKALDGIDAEYRTLRTIANAQIGDEEAIERLKKGEELSKALRKKLDKLNSIEK